jgi:hypothetical protein
MFDLQNVLKLSPPNALPSLNDEISAAAAVVAVRVACPAGCQAEAG